MTRHPFTLVLFLLAAAIAGQADQRSPANRPWPPAVQQVSGESPPLAPAEALKTFYMPPGYRLELVASEPLVHDPVAIDWDVKGRLWVVEMPGYMRDIAATGEHLPLGRIVVLRDKDADGRMDSRTVFADGLVLARSVKVLDRGVLVAEPPNIWLMRDTDGDLQMDGRELVTGRFGRRDADPQNNANGFDWALDNSMYTAGQADVHLRLKNGAFEVAGTLRRGEWGVTHDDRGRIYRNTNESALHVDLVPTAYFARNPNLLRTRGSYERLASDNPELNTVWPVRPTPGTNRAYQTGILRADGTLARFTAVCAPLVYRGDRLPAELYGNVFVTDPAANLVSRIVVDDDGTTVRARKAYERGEFLASTDERFRPVYLANAPDGTLYIVDMYRGVIEHRISITTYLRDQIFGRKLEQPIGLGRIYRVVHETTRRNTSREISTASPAELVEMLSHPSGWWRDTAQRLLVERAPELPASTLDAVVAALKTQALTAADFRARLNALWTLDGIDAIEPATVLRALEDASSDVRRSAVRVAERWLREADPSIQAAVVKRLDDPVTGVRRQVAASLGALPAGPRNVAIASLLERYGDDPVTLDAALSGLRGSEADVLARMMQSGGGQTPQRDAAIAMLAATVVRSGGEIPIQRVFDWIADDERSRWQRSALLHGAEIALLGAAMPGARSPRPARRSSNMPCPTCPGGRAGPGGAYAFPRPEPRRAVAGQAGPRLRLTREPVAISTLASGTGELGERTGRVLARVSWPNKPGDAAPLPPLSSEEQQRFDAGHDVYRNICQACHQPDGRGQANVAPSLIGSALTLAPPDIPVRVLLHGKEGNIGLMPPVGAVLSDEQIASVLTYIRREWGQAGTPVHPSTVKAIRAFTAERTRPWTTGELLELAAGRR